MILDHVLGAIPGPEAASALVARMLDEADPDVRHATVAMPGAADRAERRPRLVQALGSTDPEIVNRAAWSLAHLNAVSTVPKLVPALITTQYRSSCPRAAAGGSLGGRASARSRRRRPGRPDRLQRQLDRPADPAGRRPRARSRTARARCRSPTALFQRFGHRRRLGSRGAEPRIVPVDTYPERRGPPRPGQADRPGLRLRHPRLEALGQHLLPIETAPLAASPALTRRTSPGITTLMRCARRETGRSRTAS